MFKEDASSEQPCWSRGQKNMFPWSQSPLDVGIDAEIIDDINIVGHRLIEVKVVLFDDVQSDVMAVDASTGIIRLEAN